MFVIGATTSLLGIDSLSSGAIKRALREGVRQFFPGYFALVMATGIVSTAAYLLNIAAIAWPLFVFNLVAFSVLWLVNLLRLKFFPDVVADLKSDATSPAFLTVVASTAVVGTQFVVMLQLAYVGLTLLVAAVLFWLTLMYIFLAAVTVRSPKPTLENGINGGWLVAVVSTQSISVLACLLAPTISIPIDLTLFLALVMFLLGSFLYLVIITLVFYRFAFFPLTPGEFRQSYWINMGATAISSLAGSLLALSASDWIFLSDTLPFLRACALLLWAVSTWWIPLLVILEIWRYVDRRFPVRYDPRDWDIVFPLGMYAVATFELSKLSGLGLLAPVSWVFFWIAVLMWLIVCGGLFHQLAKTLILSQREEQAE